MANTVWAFATAGVAAETLFEAIARAAVNRIGDFEPQAMANTVWALATAGVAAETLFQAIAGATVNRIGDLNTQSMANTAWAFACIGWKHNDIFTVLSSALLERLGTLSDVDKSQLYLVTVYVQAEWPHLEFPMSAHVQSLRSAFTRQEPTPSHFQREVSTMLERLGWSHTFEYETADGFSLDLAQPESKRAIEVDGPSHYLRDPSTGDSVVNGPTRFKSRLLYALGWRVSHVAFFEWDDKPESERLQLLTAKLVELGVAVDDTSSVPARA
eukprot:CAMPEP_0118917538 /NCGR_PEP_ID=MMETSP1166-20130328/17387_1 /TAXON_ID=1104430 /ORGANISM="Chrysoreinhardia sp, Strain CCMP3193" /LENGTH=270 /DNA_ID=CAMNT_0006857727 /DNA_START=27 /DNA_END=839 /DNA_ORIENTATION=-